ncbi:MAG: hypothetical protein QM582_09545 [Micropruina sp.]|uniref:hypothetical protein n=1 Tax=Micropruina sp. TaxID=2737536 RepID=UPI0039E2624A
MANKWVASGLANRFRVEFLDGTSEEIQTIPGDSMAWERLHKLQFQDNIGATSMLWTAWRGLRREQRCTDTNFEHWADTVADFHIDTDEDAEDAEEGPTRPAL